MVTLCYLGFLMLSFLGAVSDTLFYRIPNFIVALIFVGGFINLGLQHANLDFHLVGLIFFITFLTGYLFYALKLMGAGDAKFLSASILWIQPEHAPSYFALVTISGGIIAIIFVIAHHQIDYMRLKTISFLKNKYPIPESSKGFKGYLHLPFINVRNDTWAKTLVPYGVAIFVGNLIATYYYLIQWGF